MRRTQCGGCGGWDLEVFLDLGSTPLADAFPKSADEPEDWYPLQLAVCRSCWLVQITEVVPDRKLFGADYGFYTGSSPSAVAYFADYGRWLLDRFSEHATRGVVEIACNDGTLLRHLAAAGHPVIGVEPASGPAAMAHEAGLEVLGVPFGRAEAAEIGRVGLVVANNVAAHVADLDDFFGGIADLLDAQGVAVVEVQYLPDLLMGAQFDHVYHEHRSYFGVHSLNQICRRHGLSIQQVHRTPAQGGSIRVVCQRGPSWVDSTPAEDRLGLGTHRGLDVLRTFQNRVDCMRDRLLDLMRDERDAGRRIAGYAASAKSTTLLNYCAIGAYLLEYVEDTTPHKIGRVTPGTHIPIVGPGECQRPDTFLLLAWNYLPGVLRRERGFLDGGGRFIVPIPVPAVI